MIMFKRLAFIALFLVVVDSLNMIRDKRGSISNDLHTTQKTSQHQWQGGNVSHQKHNDLNPQKILNRHKRIKKNVLEPYPDINKLLIKEKLKKIEEGYHKKISSEKHHSDMSGGGGRGTMIKPILPAVKTLKNKESLKKEINGEKNYKKLEKMKKPISTSHTPTKLHVKAKQGRSNSKKSKQKRSLDDVQFDGDEKGKKHNMKRKDKRQKKVNGSKHKKFGRNYISLAEAKRELDRRRVIANALHDKLRKYKYHKKNNKIRHFGSQYYNYDKRYSHKKNIYDDKNAKYKNRFNTGDDADDGEDGGKMDTRFVRKPVSTKFKPQQQQKQQQLKYEQQVKHKQQQQSQNTQNARLNKNGVLNKTEKDNETKIISKRGTYKFY